MSRRKLIEYMLMGAILSTSLSAYNLLIPSQTKESTRDIEINITRDKVENIKDKSRELKEERIRLDLLDKKKQMCINIHEAKEKQNNIKQITFELSAYCPCSYCCNTNTGITASGERVQEGMVALPKNIPFGTKVVIPSLDKEYVCEDRGGFIEYTDEGYMRVDVYMESHSECLQFGRFVIDGYLIYPEE